VTSERETIAWRVSSLEVSAGSADPEGGVEMTRLRDLEVIRDVTWVEAEECLNTWNSMGVWQVGMYLEEEEAESKRSSIY